MPIHTAGSVVHLSHDDTSRNQHCDNIEPTHTRNQNIVACLRSLAAGAFWGDLPAVPVSSTSLYSKPISIRLPTALKLMSDFLSLG